MNLTYGKDALFYEPVFDLTQDQISEILMELGSNYTRIQGNNVQSDHCFLHDNHSPTLGVSLDSPHPWACFVPECDSRGKSIVSLVRKALDLATSAEACAWILQRFPESRGRRGGAFGVDREEVVEKPRFDLSPAVLAAYPLGQHDDIGYRAIDYLSREMGYCFCTHAQADEYNLGYDYRHHRLIFPVYHEDGVLAGLIGRAMRHNAFPRYYNYDEGMFEKSKCIMGAQIPLVQGKPIVVVEGPTDYTYLRSCGVVNLRATMGAEISDWQIEYLCRQGFPVVPLFDKDSAGNAARAKLRKLAGSRLRFKPFKYPEEAGKDPRAVPRDLIPDLVASFDRISFI